MWIIGQYDPRRQCRWPVVLALDLAHEWLEPDTPKERAEQMVLLQDEPAEAFEWFKVDMAVGNVRNKGPELITAICKKQLSQIGIIKSCVEEPYASP